MDSEQKEGLEGGEGKGIQGVEKEAEKERWRK